MMCMCYIQSHPYVFLKFQYVEDPDAHAGKICLKSTLRQAMNGLAHLHHIGIGVFTYM